jgi:dTDP-glucose 4,6-dehydratase
VTTSHTEFTDRPILVTGGAGFIGSHFVRHWLSHDRGPVITLDALTYAGRRESLDAALQDPRHTFVHGRICDRPLVSNLLHTHNPPAIVHLAAESHVDRSIAAPAPFVQTNIVGTQLLLEAALEYWSALSPHDQSVFRFLYVSTDEVFGEIPDGSYADEGSPFRPSSPYAASKAAADHLVASYGRTFGLPFVTIHPSNNYGPNQHAEKFIPLLIVRGLRGEPLPIYGDGRQIRNWLFVEDCCRAIALAVCSGRPGERYVLGGLGPERTNLDVAGQIADLLDERRPLPGGRSRRDLIAYVADRPGHDRRYMTGYDKITRELGWRPMVAFEEGLRRTVEWYLTKLI